MCIIVAKPMNVSMPDEETLRRCFNYNSDGAGFMWANGKAVQIRKGFMKFEQLLEALDREIPEPMREETAIILHFRIATHGKVQPMCCHPFPLTDDADELRATMTKSRMGVAHNGVISGRHTNDQWSDTMDFIAHVMTPLMRMNPSFMHNSNALELLEGACDSKLAIMDNAGDIATVGKFYEEGGVLYSNTSYQRTVYGWSSYGSFWEKGYSGTGWWEWEDDDDDLLYPAKTGALTSMPATKKADYVNTEPYGEYDDDEMDVLIDMLPWQACKTCLWNEECALTYPVCDTENEAKSLSEDILAEQQEKELIELGHEEADPELYKALVESNNLALTKKGFYVD